LTEWPFAHRIFLTEARLFRPLRFLVVGGTTFVIYFTLQYLLQLAHLGPYLSLTIAYAIATAYHFSMNRHFTFRSSAVDDGIWAILKRYALVVLFSYLVTVMIVNAMMSAGFRIQVGMVVAIVLTTGMSYGLSTIWIFRARRGCRASRTRQ